MKRPTLLVLAGVFLFAISSGAKTFQISVQTGEVSVVQDSTGQKITLKDSGVVETGDSVLIASEGQAVVTIENGSRLLLKGPMDARLDGDDNSLVFVLIEGQVLLSRNNSAEISSVKVTSKGFVFSPIGTIMAVKTASNGRPSTAVLEGKVQISAPGGEMIVVGEGQFGSVDAEGKLVFGSLPQKAVESLRQWAGIQTGNIQSQNSSENTSGNVVAVSLNQSPTSTTAQQQVAQTPKKDAELEKTTQTTTASVSSSAPKEGNAKDAKATSPDNAKKGESEKNAAVSGNKERPRWEIGAGAVTVNNQQWTRIGLGVDVPIWKFGVFFDLDFYIDNHGNFSDKDWNFKDDWVDALTSKIRYIRFGHEEDPLFVKIGGLSDITLGYGFIVDRFTNMLHYPDQKLFGLQFNLNDISPIGISLQTMVSDFKEFRDDGGITAARLAFTPLKKTSIPIVKGITVGGTYAIDINQYAPARRWSVTVPTSIRMMNTLLSLGLDSSQAIDTITENWKLKDPRSDYATYKEELDATNATDQYSLIGGDVGIPLIKTPLLGLDLYGQAGIRGDNIHGWGIGVPGVALKVWRLWANLEYRRVEGYFEPGYFGPYYLDERLVRTPRVTTKENRLVSDTLNGVFGRLGINIIDVFIIDGSYQYMVGKDKANKDQRFEICGSIGDFVIQKIPKLSKAEVYYTKTNIGRERIVDKNGNIKYDSFFDETPSMYFGYRVGFAITKGASLIWDSRYGFMRDANDKIVPNNNVSIQTAITF